MSLNAAMIQAMVDKGLSGQDIADIAKAGEAKVDRTAAERQARHRAKSRSARNGVTSRRDPLIEDHKPGSHISPSGENEKDAPYPCPDGCDEDDWQSLLQTRKTAKRPMTKGAYRQIAKKLDDWKRDGWPPGPILALAVERGWQTVFPTDEMKAAQNGRSGLHPANDRTSVRGSRPNPALDMVLEAERELQAEAFSQNPGADWAARPALPPH